MTDAPSLCVAIYPDGREESITRAELAALFTPQPNQEITPMSDPTHTLENHRGPHAPLVDALHDLAKEGKIALAYNAALPLPARLWIARVNAALDLVAEELEAMDERGTPVEHVVVSPKARRPRKPRAEGPQATPGTQETLPGGETP
jgi:hypothetical protein